jgi:hypothetical protein
VEVLLQKTEHTGRRSQPGQCEDSISITAPPSSITHQHSIIRFHGDKQQGQRQQHSIFSSKSRAWRILASRKELSIWTSRVQIESLPYPGISRSLHKWGHCCNKALGRLKDLNSSAKKDRQTSIKVAIEGPSSPPSEHGTVGKRNSPVIDILRRSKNWTGICGVRTTHRPRCI